MADRFAGKRVPWSQLEEYLDTHEGAIGTYLQLLKRKLADVPEIEVRLPRSFT